MIYRHFDYKQAVKDRFKEAREKKASLTLKSLAVKVGVQPTYLSRCLNDDRSHLSEDHLYSMARLLKLQPAETDYLLLLRQYATTQDKDRKEKLFTKIESERKGPLASVERQKWDPQALQEETAYLFNPSTIVVHAALFIDEHKRNPRGLCTALGLTTASLKEILKLLHARDYIVLDDEDPFKVLEVKNRKTHFGREHPLMRSHQATMKTALNARLMQTSEEEKESLFFTFTMTSEGFVKARDLYKEFLSNVQKISMETPKPKQAEHVYQMSFDLLKWL